MGGESRCSVPEPTHCSQEVNLIRRLARYGGMIMNSRQPHPNSLTTTIWSPNFGRRLLEKDFDVVGAVGDGRALVRVAGELKPDVIILDIAMPVLNGLDAGRQVKKLLPGVKLVYLTMNPDADVAAEAFARGASGYLLKTCAAAEMVQAVHEVLRGKTYLSKALSAMRSGFAALAE